MMRLAVLCLVLCSFTAQSDELPAQQRQALEPTMRPVDRDWSYFKSVSCEDIEKLVSHSRSEQILLAKRKKQCLDKYRAFLPAPVDR